MLGDGQDDDLDGRHARREHQTVVVAVGHDEAAYHAGGHAPAGLKRGLQLVLPVGEGDAEGLGEAVAEVVAGAGLQRLVVVHHALDGVGVLRAGELLLVGLVAAQHGHGQQVLADVGVYLEHLPRLVQSLLGGGVDGVTLLPEELASAQEGAGGLLPAEHAAPLVVETGQVAPGVDYVAPVLAEQRLAGGADAQPLGQLLAAADGDPRALGREALNVVFFLLKQALGDEQRHGDVLVSRGLELPVQLGLDVFPNRIAVGAQDEKALYPGVVDQLGLEAHVGEPLGKVLLHIGYALDFFVLRHDI